MPQIPAICPTHGPFRSGVELRGGSTLTLGQGTSTCPVCGEPAPVLSGTFQDVGDVIRVLAAPAWTIGKIKMLQNALATPPDDGDINAALNRVARVSEDLAEAIRQQIDKPGWTRNQKLAMWAMIIPTLLWVLGQVAEERRATRGDLSEERVRQIVEESERSDPIPSVPPSPEPERPSEP